MKIIKIESGPIYQSHEVTVEIKGVVFGLNVKTRNGVVDGGYLSVITFNGEYFKLSDATRKKHFKELKQYVEASLRAKSITCDKIINDIDEYKIQLAGNKKISETKFQAMQEAIYGCKVIVRRLFGKKQKIEKAIIK